jgi:putative intracellular protease/amidase
MPADYAALILIGGFGWESEEAKKLVPIIKQAISKGIVVGAICNGASFLAQNGFLNNIKHTGNGLDELKRWGGDNYTNEAGYQNQQAVSDHGIVTANGTASLEFAVELMRLLKIDTPEDISAYFQFMKLGFCEFMKQLK